MRILQADTLNEIFCVRVAGKSTLSNKRREVAHGHFPVRGRKQKCDHNRDHVSVGNTQRLTSYLMTGLTQHYGDMSNWFRYSKFPGDGIVMWEANEFRGHWNDGSNFIREGSPQLSFRHFNRANLLSLSGGVESWFSTEYDAESAKLRSRLIYCPLGHAH